MRKVLFILLFFGMGMVGASAQSNRYDQNADGDVNITDVTMLVNGILQQNENNEYDLNEDGEVNITDVIELVNYILEGHDNLLCPDSNHPHLIDLGLPSGTKWACCNVGADKPEGYGGYYAWGETEEKDSYFIHNYQYAFKDKNGNILDEESWQPYLMISIGLNIAGMEYDVAHEKWGGNWCLPTDEQNGELKDNCDYKWIDYNGVKGGLFTSKINGNSIFLPAGGSVWRNGHNNFGTSGNYWSSTQDTVNVLYAYALYFDYRHVDLRLGSPKRQAGYGVRPVMK